MIWSELELILFDLSEETIQCVLEKLVKIGSQSLAIVIGFVGQQNL